MGVQCITMDIGRLRKFVKMLKTKKLLISYESFNGTPCWEYKGYHTAKGYGQMYYDGRSSHIVHHWMYETFRSLLGDLVPDHLCLRKWCANPWHCEAVTREENSRRANIRTHCQNGHLLTDENIYHHKDGTRGACKICAKKKAVDWNRDNGYIHQSRQKRVERGRHR